MQFALLIFLCIFPCKLYAEPKPISCESNADCQNFIESSICDEEICKCPFGRLLSSDGTKCLGTVNGYGSTCEDNIQCSEALRSGGVCVSNTCKCKENFHYKNQSCWKNLDLDEDCSHSEHCFSAYEYVGLECNNKKCKCRENYYQRFNSGCRRKSGVGEICNIDSDCPTGSECNNMICSAFSEATDWDITIFPHIRQIGTIDPDVIYELGNYCRNDGDCSEIKNAICLEQICICIPNKYVGSESNMQCLPSTRGKVESISKSSCKENAQCAVFGGKSACVNNKCECKAGSYFDKEAQFCWSSKSVGEDCSSTKDCNPSLTNSDCLNGKCTCTEGYHQKETICQQDATKVGDACVDDQDCLFEHSVCSEKVCACNESYFAENGKCVPGVKSTCLSDADCCHLRNAYCKSNNSSSGQCECYDGYITSDEGKYCLPEVMYGGKCHESFQCKTDLGDLGECLGGICKCPNKTHYSYKKCYKSQYVRERCNRIQDCHPGNDQNSVICGKGFCLCNHGYQENDLGLCYKLNSAAGMRPYFYAVLAALLLLL